MRGRRLDAGLGLECRDLLQPEPVAEIDERIVLDEDRDALERGRLLVPICHRRTPALRERLVPRLVVRRIRRVELGQAGRERCGDAGDIAWIGLDVGITSRMDIALGAIETHRLFKECRVTRRLEIARLASLDLRIPGLLRDERQPADFELGTGGDDEVRAPRASDETRLGLDMMRVLQRIGCREDLDLVTAQLFGERAPFGHGSENVQCGQPRRRYDRECGRGNQLQTGIHWIAFQNLCAPCAPIVRMYWTNNWLSVRSGRILLCCHCTRNRLNSDGV